MYVWSTYKYNKKEGYTIMPELNLETQQQNALQFVQSLSLPAPSNEMVLTAAQGPLKVLSTPEAGAAVDDQSIVCFVGGLNDQLRSDVLNSTLLAQLAASAKFPKDPNNFQYNVAGWYNCYTDTLQKVGWNIQGLSFSQHQVSGSTFQVNEVVMQLLASIATNNAAMIVKSALEALDATKAKQSQAITLWKSHTDNDANGSFQVSCCSETNGCAAMALGAFYLTGKNNSKHILWFDFSSSDTKVQCASTQVVLNNDIYSTVRNAVVQKLGNAATSFVADLDIGDV